MDEGLKMPQHVAIILDGNGRWARAKGMPRNYGHVQGAKTVETICEEAYRMGIQYLTVYAFSTENWGRPQDEVDALMKLLRNYMKTCLKTAEKNRMCVRVLGEKSRLDKDIRVRIQELEEATKDNDGLHFQIAINYGGRDAAARGHHGGHRGQLPGHGGDTGAGFADTHLQRAENLQFPSVAAGLHGVLCHPGSLAGFHQRRIDKSCGSI